MVTAASLPSFTATDDLKMYDGERSELARQVFAIEKHHRQLKQCYGVERAQVRTILAQKRHIALSLCAFMRLETYQLQIGISGTPLKQTLLESPFTCICRNQAFG